MTPKVLILTASYGSGHVIAAKGLDEALRKKGVEPVVFDLVEIGGKTERLGSAFYSFLMRRGHFIWKLYHEKVMPIKKGDSIRKVYELLQRGKFFKNIENINPDIIISTMDQASVVASLFKRDHPQVKIATVLTDYVIHPIWVWKNMDYYFIGSDEIQKYLEKHGIKASTIHKTGIPLRSQFEKVPDKKEARRTLGIPDDGRIVLLLSGGSFNSIPIRKILDVLKGRKDLFIVILAGNEEKIADFLDMLKINSLTGKVVGYTDQMSAFMVASDLFISKAGGVTTAECLACSLPAIYINNLPGHEIGNATYTEKNGASKIAKNKDELEKILSKLLENKDGLEKMSRNARKISQPHCSSEIVKILM